MLCKVIPWAGCVLFNTRLHQLQLTHSSVCFETLCHTQKMKQLEGEPLGLQFDAELSSSPGSWVIVRLE